MTASEKKKVTHLVEHELALKVYLDSLLFDDALAEPEELPQVESPQLEPVAPPPSVTPDIEVKEQVAEVVPEIVSEQISETEVQLQPEEALPPTKEEPEWEANTFECLMFKVAGGLTLSVPLVRLNGILPWADDVTFMPGHAEWFLGLIKNRGKQVKVVDIAKFVIPHNHKARESLSEERNFKHIILIDEGQFGIACDGLGDVLKLTQDKVRWRTDRSSRPWLAGTVIDHMCALMDVDSLLEMLKDGRVHDDISEES